MSRTATAVNLGQNINYVVDHLTGVQNIDGNKISWGEPAKVCLARMDRTCPACGAHWRDVQYNGTLLIAGFESDGKDGLCGDCGYAFTTGIGQDDPPASDTKASKPGPGKGKRGFSKRAAKAKRTAKTKA
jgi:hypothetical protein